MWVLYWIFLSRAVAPKTHIFLEFAIYVCCGHPSIPPSTTNIYSHDLSDIIHSETGRTCSHPFHCSLTALVIRSGSIHNDNHQRNTRLMVTYSMYISLGPVPLPALGHLPTSVFTDYVYTVYEKFGPCGSGTGSGIQPDSHCISIGNPWVQILFLFGPVCTSYIK